MSKKNGFTLVELIGVIIIISILLILLVPNITRVSGKSKVSLRDSKINIIKTAATNYGNDLINDYQDCMGLSSGDLATKCTVSLDELIRKGYMESDTDKTSNLIDPITNKELKGKVLLCFDPINVNINAEYVEDDNYSCPSVDLGTGNTLTVVPIKGNGYVGGKSVEASIISNGSFSGGFSCKSSDTTYATCKVENNKLKIDITNDRDLDFGNSEFEEITITVKGKYRDESGLVKEMSKDYTLKVYPTSLSISNPGEFCMTKNTLDELEINSLNPGDFYINSTDQDILVGSVKNNKVTLTSGEKTGNATLTIIEGNGGRSESITRNVYDFSASFPNAQERRLGLNADKTIKFVHKSTGKVTISSSDGKILKLTSSSNPQESESITITDENEAEFKIIAKSEGTAKIRISTETCGSPIEEEFTVINMSLKIPEMTTYAGSKEVLTNDIIVENPSELTCSSSNEAAATCSISNTTLRIIPGTQVDDNVTITVSSPKNGITSMKLHVLNTDIKITNENGNDISYICSEVEKGHDSEKAYVSGANLAGVSLEVDDKLVTASIDLAEAAGRRRILISNSYVSGNVNSPYKEGYNTGKTSIKAIEDRGGKSDSVDYYIYDLKVLANGEVLEEAIQQESISMEMNVGSNENLEVSSSITGNITVSVDNPSKLDVSVNNVSYNEGINVYNKQILNVRAKEEGQAVITVKGSLCGEKKYRIKIKKIDYFVEFKTGTYTEAVFADRENCTASNSASCEVLVPDFLPKEGFDKGGFSLTKDSKTAEYQPGEMLTIDASNAGKTYYANSIDYQKPICEFLEVPDYLPLGESLDLKLQCYDMDSGFSQKYYLDYDDFEFSNDNVTVQIGEPIDISKGYMYNLHIETKKAGLFKIKLKNNIMKDNFENFNDELSFTNILISEYKPFKLWYVGKINEDDIVAELVQNSIYKSDAEDKKYSLLLYGTGEANDYLSQEVPTQSPWNDTIIIDNIRQQEVENEESTDESGSVTDNTLFVNDKITDVVINDNILSVGNNMFSNMLSLKNLSLPEGLKRIGENAFVNANLSEINIPSSVESIGAYAFELIESTVEFLIIGKDYLSIDDFKNNQVNLNFNNNNLLTEIANNVFSGVRFKEINIPETIEKIGQEAFARKDTNPIKVNFGLNSRLKIIDDFAFKGAVIEEINFPSKLETIGSYAIFTSGIEKIILSPSLKQFGEAAITGKDLIEFEIAEENQYFATIDGLLYNKDLTELVKCPDFYGKTHETINVLESVTSLKEGSFIATLYYGEDVIGAELNLSENVKSLNEEKNFQGFTLSKININNENYSTENGILYNADKTILYWIPTAHGAKELMIPDTVTTIFDLCGYMNFKVSTITIPESVINIGNDAFRTDSAYGFSKIYLLVKEDANIMSDSFSVASFDNENYSLREVYLTSEILKTKLEYSHKHIDQETHKPSNTDPNPTLKFILYDPYGDLESGESKESEGVSK